MIINDPRNRKNEQAQGQAQPLYDLEGTGPAVRFRIVTPDGVEQGVVPARSPLLKDLIASLRGGAQPEDPREPAVPAKPITLAEMRSRFEAAVADAGLALDGEAEEYWQSLVDNHSELCQCKCGLISSRASSCEPVAVCSTRTVAGSDTVN